MPDTDSEDTSSSSNRSSPETACSNGYMLLPQTQPAILEGGLPIQKLPQDLLLR